MTATEIAEYGAKVARPERGGTLLVSSDGKTFQVHESKGGSSNADASR